MDAVRLLATVRPILAANGARWALAGGFAVVALGGTRTTFDLDLAVDDAVHAALVPAFAAAGFEVVQDSEGFTNLLHPDPGLGRLDMIWVEGETSRKLFGAARDADGPDGAPIRVLAPEHLVAMKVKAIAVQPTRALRDAADLEVLLRLPGLDENQARGYFERAGLLELWNRIRGT